MAALPKDGQDHGWERVLEPSTVGSFVTRAGVGAVSPGAPGEVINVLVDGSHTRGLATFLEARIAAGQSGPPTHWHRGHDEFFYLVSGELAVTAAGDEHVLRARDFLFVPRGVSHSFGNPSDQECIFVSGWNPPGAERLFHRLQELTPEELGSPEVFVRLFEDFDTQLVPPGA